MERRLRWLSENSISKNVVKNNTHHRVCFVKKPDLTNF